MYVCQTVFRSCNRQNWHTIYTNENLNFDISNNVINWKVNESRDIELKIKCINEIASSISAHFNHFLIDSTRWIFITINICTHTTSHTKLGKIARQFPAVERDRVPYDALCFVKRRWYAHSIYIHKTKR